MKNRLRILSVALALSALCIVSAGATAPAAKSAPQGRGAEELGYLVGTWRLEGELASHPVYGNAKVSGTMSCEWFDGHASVLCRVEQTGDQGSVPTKALRIFGYSTDAKAYTSYGVISGQNSTEVDLGQFKNGTWSYTAKEKMLNGKKVKVRENITQVSATSFKLSQEQSVAGGGWKKLAAATFTKAN